MTDRARNPGPDVLKGTSMWELHDDGSTSMIGSWPPGGVDDVLERLLGPRFPDQTHMRPSSLLLFAQTPLVTPNAVPERIRESRRCVIELLDSLERYAGPSYGWQWRDKIACVREAFREGAGV